MHSLTSLTVLAFVAGALLNMAAAKTGTGHKRIYLNESYFTETNCKPLEEDKCDYPNACFCYPPFANGRSRIPGYFYSPEHKKCIKPSGGIGIGCNSFEDKMDCFKQCGRKLNPGKYKIKNTKRR
uniref:Putative secreted protein n=1 Tax=Amblyomma americanum TaxID=6943 RepID=A0A0C9SEW1_AMBAM